MAGDVCPLVVSRPSFPKPAIHTGPKRELFLFLFLRFLLLLVPARLLRSFTPPCPCLVVVRLLSTAWASPTRRHHYSFAVVLPIFIHSVSALWPEQRFLSISHHSTKSTVLHDRRITSVPLLSGYLRNSKHVSSRVVSEYTLSTHTIIQCGSKPAYDCNIVSFVFGCCPRVVVLKPSQM